MTDINKTLNELYKLIDNDSFAATFQSLTQYRNALKACIVDIKKGGGKYLEIM